MNLLTAVLSGAVWVLARLGLALLAALGAALLLALAALLIPFCADVAWEGEAGDPDAPGRLRVRAGACGITLPVWEYPKPAPPPGAPSAPPGFYGPARMRAAPPRAPWGGCPAPAGEVRRALRGRAQLCSSAWRAVTPGGLPGLPPHTEQVRLGLEETVRIVELQPCRGLPSAHPCPCHLRGWGTHSSGQQCQRLTASGSTASSSHLTSTSPLFV